MGSLHLTLNARDVGPHWKKEEHPSSASRLFTLGALRNGRHPVPRGGPRADPRRGRARRRACWRPAACDQLPRLLCSLLQAPHSLESWKRLTRPHLRMVTPKQILHTATAHAKRSPAANKKCAYTHIQCSMKAVTKSAFSIGRSHPAGRSWRFAGQHCIAASSGRWLLTNRFFDAHNGAVP
jgi:hypothetical protein